MGMLLFQANTVPVNSALQGHEIGLRPVWQSNGFADLPDFEVNVPKLRACIDCRLFFLQTGICQILIGTTP